MLALFSNVFFLLSLFFQLGDGTPEESISTSSSTTDQPEPKVYIIVFYWLKTVYVNLNYWLLLLLCIYNGHIF